MAPAAVLRSVAGVAGASCMTGHLPSAVAALDDAAFSPCGEAHAAATARAKTQALRKRREVICEGTSEERNGVMEVVTWVLRVGLDLERLASLWGQDLAGRGRNVTCTHGEGTQVGGIGLD